MPQARFAIGWGELGRDFWLFRFGQLISVIGDSCGGIALAWWILDVTGSAAAMASIIAPAMFARIFLLPLFGPLGDRFARKWLAFYGDIWRGVVMCGIAALIFGGIFRLPLVITLFILVAVGSSLFSCAAGSIVPQLVKKEHLQKAMQQEQAINAFGSMIGGIGGGLMVTLVGTGRSIVIDAVSFFIAAAATLMITADTEPERSATAERVNPLVAWFQDLKQGFKVVIKIPVELWMAMVAGLMNFILAPIGIALPVLVKQARAMPPWFLGALGSSISIGSIVGAFAVGYICRKVFADFVITAGIVVIGLGVAVLPGIPNPALPIIMMFCIGIGTMLANIPLHTQMTLAMPDEFRARSSSVTTFICLVASPLGMAFAGALISAIGLNLTMLICGGSLVLTSPLLFLIPKFSVFCRLPPEEASRFYTENYPQAFQEAN
jgi:MFS family permease